VPHLSISSEGAKKLKFY